MSDSESAEPGATTREASADGQVLVVRPRHINIYGGVAAAAILASMIALAAALGQTNGGVRFHVFDQAGLVAVGVFGAAVVMMVARPRLRADAEGMAVRNVLGEAYFPWSVVVRIAFPPGAHWAQIVMADDDAHPLMAIQSMDRQRAVDALHAVRALHAKYGPTQPTASPEDVERRARRRQAEIAAAAARPLGRLEIIDRKRAARNLEKNGRDRPSAGRGV